MGIRKPPPLLGKLVDVRCLQLRRAIATKVAVAEIVRKDQNNIGQLLPAQDGDVEAAKTPVIRSRSVPSLLFICWLSLSTFGGIEL